MWLTFSITIIIGSAWFIKSIIKKQFQIQRTPLDIPILFFLLSQIISTLFSWDFHVSFWGYYSRFNGGLLSNITYAFLFYAFVSNFLPKDEALKTNGDNSLNAGKIIKHILLVSIASGIIVSLWGLPSRFGYDPTCFVFRGTFDVSCWTNDFQPKIRIFSTLGQPDWLAAYLVILLPISFVFFIKNFYRKKINEVKSSTFYFLFPNTTNSILLSLFYFGSIILFCVDLLYSNSRSGILSALLSLFFFLTIYIWYQFRRKSIQLPIIIALSGIIIYILMNQPLVNINLIFSQNSNINSTGPTEKPVVKTPKQEPVQHIGEFGGTDSSKIRKYVWTGAIEAWKNYPLFGTGVETFAFAYYKYKPAGQNLTSEWNFLYNKAHNEYLNYLATTGIFGLGMHLFIIGFFFFILYKRLINVILKPDEHRLPLMTLALLSSYISILITNFFGFSIVIVNIYFFLIPAFVFFQEGLINTDKRIKIPKSEINIENKSDVNPQLSPLQWTGVISVLIIAFYFLITLYTYWDADKSYAYGSNLDKSGYTQEAYDYLHKAVKQRSGEPVFKDALVANNAALATKLLLDKDKVSSETAQTASNIAQEAINTSNDLILNYSNNIVFWKTRVRMFYTLSQVDIRFLPQALEAVRKASSLAPNDASILYNHGVLEGQNGNINEAIKILERTIALKPDYRDLYFALGLFYHQAAVDKDGRIINQELFQKGVDQMQFILDHFNREDGSAKEALKTWGKL